jgi:hypothetical protein
MDEFYRNKASVEIQSKSDEEIRETLPQAKISLSSAYALKARFEDRINSNQVASTIEAQEDLKPLQDVISEGETKNYPTPTLIKNLYQHRALCYRWGSIPPAPKEPYSD